MKFTTDKFYPLNISFKGSSSDPTASGRKSMLRIYLEGLTSIDVKNAGSTDRVKVLKSLLAKVVP